MSATIFLALSCALGAVESTSPLSAEPAEIELGELVSGGRVRNTFRVRHVGDDGRILIRSVTGSCGCSVSESDRRELAPGESTSVFVSIFTAGQPAGPNRWKISVRYTQLSGAGREPFEGVLYLFVTAKLKRQVSVEPAELQMALLANQRDAEPVERVLTLQRHIDGPLKVTGTKSSTDRLQVTSIEPISPNEARLRLRISGDWPAGDRHEIVSIRTDDPELPEVAIPVRVVAKQQRPILASPSTVIFRLPSGGGPISRLVQIRASDGSPITISSATSLDPKVKVVWPSGSYPVGTIRVKMTAEAAMSAGETEIRVELAEPEGMSVVIPVSWRTP